MIAVELRTKVAPVLKSLMLNHGVIALPAGPTVFRLLPPLVITEKEINLGVQAIAKAIKELPGLMDRAAATELVRGLVAIPSLSRQEAAASAWLVEQMRAAGYDRAFVDDAGNAVGELGDPSASRTIVLLGHIDTVPGNIPVRIEAAEGAAICCSAAAASTRRGRSRRSPPARRASDQRRRKAADLRVVVVGAVEEEAATSKGARFIASRFDGKRRTDSDRVHHRRAEPLESRHARLQGTAAARLHRRSADGAHRRSRCERRVGRRRLLELGDRARRARQRRQGQGLRSAEPEPAPLHHLDQRADARHRRRAVRVAAAGRLRRRRVHEGARGTGRQANRQSGRQDDVQPEVSRLREGLARRSQQPARQKFPRRPAHRSRRRRNSASS